MDELLAYMEKVQKTVTDFGESEVEQEAREEVMMMSK